MHIYIGLREGGSGLQIHFYCKWGSTLARTYSTTHTNEPPLSRVQMSHCKWVGFGMRTKPCVRVSLNKLYPATRNALRGIFNFRRIHLTRFFFSIENEFKAIFFCPKATFRESSVLRVYLLCCRSQPYPGQWSILLIEGMFKLLKLGPWGNFEKFLPGGFSRKQRILTFFTVLS